MNKSGIKYVRDFLAALPEKKAPVGFNMKWWHDEIGTHTKDHSGHQCGTTACLGGWTEMLLTKKGKPFVRPDYQLIEYVGALDTAEEFGSKLGLSADDSRKLFHASGIEYRERGSITIPQAVAVLDILLETGKVDWKAAVKRAGG